MKKICWPVLLFLTNIHFFLFEGCSTKSRKNFMRFTYISLLNSNLRKTWSGSFLLFSDRKYSRAGKQIILHCNEKCLLLHLEDAGERSVLRRTPRQSSKGCDISPLFLAATWKYCLEIFYKYENIHEYIFLLPTLILFCKVMEIN